MNMLPYTQQKLLM